MSKSPLILAAASFVLLVTSLVPPALAATLTFTNTVNSNGHVGNHTRASFNTALQGATLSWVVGTSGSTYWAGSNDIVTITFQTSSANCQNVAFVPAAANGALSGSGSGRTLTITFPATTIASTFGEGACIISSIAMSASYDSGAATDSGTYTITGGTSTVYEAAPVVSSIIPTTLAGQTSGSFSIDGTHLPFGAEFPNGASVELIVTGTGCGSMAAVATTPITDPTSTSRSIPFTVTAPVVGCSVVLNKLQRSSFVASITASPATVATYQEAAPVGAPVVPAPASAPVAAPQAAPQAAPVVAPVAAPTIAAPVAAPTVAAPVDAPVIAAPQDSQQAPVAAPMGEAAPLDSGSAAPVEVPVSADSAPANAPSEVFTRTLDMRLDVESTNLNATAVASIKQILVTFFEIEAWGPSVIKILNINGATLPIATRKRAVTPFTAVFTGDAALVAKIDAKISAWTEASRTALAADLANAAGAASGMIVVASAPTAPGAATQELPAGTIVGIVIACALGLVVAIVIVYVLMQGRRAEEKRSHKSKLAKADDPAESSSPKEVRASKKVDGSSSSSEEAVPLNKTEKKQPRKVESSSTDESEKSDHSKDSDSESSEQEMMIHKKVEKKHESSSGSDEDQSDSDDESSEEPISLVKKLEAKANKKDESSDDEEDSPSSSSSSEEQKKAPVESSESSSSSVQVKKTVLNKKKSQEESSSSSHSDSEVSSSSLDSS